VYRLDPSVGERVESELCTLFAEAVGVGKELLGELLTEVGNGARELIAVPITSPHTAATGVSR
jgi:hypothetical protein